MDAETKQPSRLRFRGGPPEVPLDIYLDRSCIGGCVFPLEVHKPVRRLPQADKKELHLQTTSLTVDEEGSVTQIRRFEELAKINFLLSEDPSSPTLPIPNDEADLVLKASYGHALYCGVLTSFTTGRGTCESNASAYTTNIAYDAAANPTLITSPGTSLNGVVQTGHVETRPAGVKVVAAKLNVIRCGAWVPDLG